jgi:DNA replication protein DnaC
MEDLQLMRQKLKKLKLSGIATALEEKLQQAGSQKWSYYRFLDMLVTDELDAKLNNQLIKRLSRSHLDPNKTLETFDFSFNEKIQAAFVKDLGRCDFVLQKQNIFILGPSGVGKSHLAQALGHEACRRGFEVIFFGMRQLFDWLQHGKGDGSYQKKIGCVIKTSLIILDDFCLESFNETEQSELYKIISEKYEKSSLIITSNRDFNEWGGCFPNPILAMASLDRLVHKGIQIVIEGNSYRLEEFKKRPCMKLKKIGEK